MEILYAALLGAIFNRIRGSWLSKQLGGNGKPLNDTVFACLMAYLSAHSIPFIYGLPLYYLAMLIGRTPGWGSYIGAMIMRTTQPGEIAFIDKAIERLKPNPVLWGWAGLSLRGLMWGAPISLVTLSTIPAHIGLCMGTAYLLAIKIREWREGKLASGAASSGWALGEVIWGAVLWAGCAYAAVQ